MYIYVRSVIQNGTISAVCFRSLNCIYYQSESGTVEYNNYNLSQWIITTLLNALLTYDNYTVLCTFHIDIHIRNVSSNKTRGRSGQKLKVV